MDSAYNVVDSFQIGNGYVSTDPHDFQLLENGNAFVIAIDWQPYAMDTVVPGGNPNALVGGFIIQEQDPEKNVIFQWRSWDHFLITDAGPQIDLTDLFIDYVHGNAVEVESDTSILISSRSLDEITKIHRNTGDIIWRFGGKKNQFVFVNDTLGFTMQHDCRRLQNGNVTLFDNGTMHPEPKFSSALEYELDEINLEATLIRRLRNDPDIYGNAMGNAQWKSDSSVVVGWGNGVPGITEFNLDGEVNMEIQFQGISYRAFRFPWETTYFSIDVDSVFYDMNSADTITDIIELYNPNDFEIEISSISTNIPFIHFTDTFPLSVSSAEFYSLEFNLTPDTSGIFQDVITINSDINTDTLVQRVAKQFLLEVLVAPEQTTFQHIIPRISVFPNPADKDVVVQLNFYDFTGRIQLHNINGEVVKEKPICKDSRINFSIQHLANGIYFITLVDRDETIIDSHKLIINK
jgi:hypothetical protein